MTHVEDEAEKSATRIVKLGGNPAVITSDHANTGIMSEPLAPLRVPHSL